MNWEYPLQIVRAAARRPIIQFAIKVSLVVGTILNLINQGGAMFGDSADSAFNLMHCVLNYLVPFFVSAFSGGRNELRLQRESMRETSGD